MMRRACLASFVFAALLSAQTKGPLKLGDRRPPVAPPQVPIVQDGDQKPAPAKPEAKSDTSTDAKTDPKADAKPSAPVAAKAAEAPVCVADEEETGRPKLQRGKPTERKSKACETLATPIGAALEAENVKELDANGVELKGEAKGEAREVYVSHLPDELEKVRVKVDTYSRDLPNFLCEELIRRMSSGLGRRNFSLRDTVTVDVTYVDGKEDYKNAKRNGKAMGWQETQKSGSWSEGEFGSVIQDILSPTSNGKFVYRKKDTIGGIDTDVFDFVVQQPNSHWTLTFGGQSYKPKYKGSVWVDPKVSMLLRIEMQAMELPASFPIEHSELMLEYGPIKIDTKFYTLPKESANLACFRAEAVCSKNEIEFRKYRKFSAESNISTTETSVTFDGEEKKTPPPPATTKKK